jgi:hypothetical protein
MIQITEWMETRKAVADLIESDAEIARRNQQVFSDLAEKSLDPKCVELRRQRNDARQMVYVMWTLNLLTIAAWVFVTWLNHRSAQ